MFDVAGKRVYVAGHRGMVGSAVARRLAREKCEVLTVSRGDLDLTRQRDVDRWMARNKPDALFLCAAKVGGILANDRSPVDFLYDNLLIEANVIKAAHAAGVAKLLFLGSSCIYPKFAPQPIAETALLTSALEPTNQWYAIAKIAGVKLCEAYRAQYGADFISAIPANIYGPEDNFDPATSHVVPALLRKAHGAKLAGTATIEIWGSGRPLREFLYVDDLADALVFLMKHYSEAVPINIGTGGDISIADLARLVVKVVGFKGGMVFDTGKPDGTPRKLLDISALSRLGWQATTPLEAGLVATYDWYKTNVRRQHGQKG
jgi:GDP-L-fucose synthase